MQLIHPILNILNKIGVKFLQSLIQIYFSLVKKMFRFIRNFNVKYCIDNLFLYLWAVEQCGKRWWECSGLRLNKPYKILKWRHFSSKKLNHWLRIFITPSLYLLTCIADTVARLPICLIFMKQTKKLILKESMSVMSYNHYTSIL